MGVFFFACLVGVLCFFSVVNLSLKVELGGKLGRPTRCHRCDNKLHKFYMELSHDMKMGKNTVR